MLCVDVNVLVYAHRADVPHHDRYAGWLDRARRGKEAFGVPSLCLSGFLRVVTHPKVFRDPTPVQVALDFVEGLRATTNYVAVHPGYRHWSIFADLCRAVDARGNVVPDAYLAAMAIERRAVMYTVDRGFARFPELQWRHPLDDVAS